MPRIVLVNVFADLSLLRIDDFFLARENSAGESRAHQEGLRRGGVAAGMWPPLRGIRISTVPSPRHFENGQAGTAIDIADSASRVARGTSRTSASRSSFPRTNPYALRELPAKFGSESYRRAFPEFRRVDQYDRTIGTIPRRTTGRYAILIPCPTICLMVAHFLTPERSNSAHGPYGIRTYARFLADLFHAWNRAIAHTAVPVLFVASSTFRIVTQRRAIFSISALGIHVIEWLQGIGFRFS